MDSVVGSEATVDENVGGISSKESIGDSNEARIRSKRSVVKRRITTTLRKLEALIWKSGSKTMIKGYVNNLSEYLKEAEALNNELLGLIHEKEHETVLNWFEEQLERIEDAKLEAENHLEERLHEVSSVAGTFPGMQASPQRPHLYSKSVLTCSSKSSGKGAEVRAKAVAAELRAKQLIEEEEKRKDELEKQLQLERNIALAREVAERAKVEAEERRKIQEAKDELKRLQAEAEILEREDPESLTKRLCDFEDEALNDEQIAVTPDKSPTRDPAQNATGMHVPDVKHDTEAPLSQVQATTL